MFGIWAGSASSGFCSLYLSFFSLKSISQLMDWGVLKFRFNFVDSVGDIIIEFFQHAFLFPLLTKQQKHFCKSLYLAKKENIQE